MSAWSDKASLISVFGNNKNLRTEKLIQAYTAAEVVEHYKQTKYFVFDSHLLTVKHVDVN